jgi:drug/metabolite transporter (DMT)-like permease
MRRPPVPPVLVLGLGILAVSSSSILIRFAQAEAPSLSIAAWRLSLAALLLAPLALTRGRAEIASLTWSERGLALISGIFLALHFATWISSLAFTSVASSVVLVSTAPLWVALLSPLTLKESLSRPMLIGMLLALVGGVIVALSDTCSWSASGLVCPELGEFLRGRAFLGDLLALAGAVAVAGYLIIGRRLRARVSLLGYIFMVYGMAALVLLLVVFATGMPMTGFSPKTYIWLLGLAVLPQLVGHTTYNWALAYLSAAFVSITVLGEPVGSSILAYFLLEEEISQIKLVGAALTLVGIYLATRSEAGKPSS